MLHYAFDHGIVSFDLANNYGPGYGTAEETFGYVYHKSLRPYRDELFISSKAGYDMWPGPYGNWGSRKYLISSLDQSLRRMGLDYVDVFYSHRFDPETPLEETLQALVDIVRQGKALYAGISRCPKKLQNTPSATRKNATPRVCSFGDRYNLFDRSVVENGVLDSDSRQRFRLHCIFTSGSRHTYQPVLKWRSGRFSRGRKPFPIIRTDNTGNNRQSFGAQRYCG